MIQLRERENVRNRQIEIYRKWKHCLEDRSQLVESIRDTTDDGGEGLVKGIGESEREKES